MLYLINYGYRDKNMLNIFHLSEVRLKKELVQYRFFTRLYLPVLFFMMTISSDALAKVSSYQAYQSCKDQPNAGLVAVCHVNLAYSNATYDCRHPDNSSHMGGQCSGVMLRAVKPHNVRRHKAWDYNPSYAGISFSYLRKDAKFGAFVAGQTTGFIFYPTDHTPSGKNRINIMCGFPVDGDTIYRNKMCGMDRDYKDTIPCEDQNIDSAAKWVDLYEKGAKTSPYPNIPGSAARTCGFRLNGSNEPQKMRSFSTFVASRNTLLNNHPNDPDFFHAENEVILEKWDVSRPATIPIEAFFYVNDGSSAPLISVQLDQKDYYDATGEAVPIIQITLPKNNNDDAAFAYKESDQKVKVN